MIALQAITPERLVELLPALTASEGRKVVALVHRGVPLQPCSGLRRAAVDVVRAAGTVPALSVEADHRSVLDPFRKLVLRTPDGELIETVRIPLEKRGRYSVCVSSQAGCALGCAFCATGRMGLRRNLQTWEIVEQVRVVRGTLHEVTGARVHGVVFQGMGEPLANLDRVIESIEVLSCPSGLAIDQRAMTVSTSGLPSGIRRLARALPKVRLGISLHAARSHVRRSLMPIEASHALDELLDAAIEHARTTGLAPMWAVTLLHGVNDSLDDALALVELTRRFAAATDLAPRISVVPYNRIDDDERDPFRRSGDAREQAFRDALHAHGIFTHKRYSGGSDVSAACGQLRT